MNDQTTIGKRQSVIWIERAVDPSCIGYISSQHVHSPLIISKKTKSLPSVWCSQGVSFHNQTVHQMYPVKTGVHFITAALCKISSGCVLTFFFGTELAELTYCRCLAGGTWPLTSPCSSGPCGFFSYKWQHYLYTFEEFLTKKCNQKPLDSMKIY